MTSFSRKNLDDILPGWTVRSCTSASKSSANGPIFLACGSRQTLSSEVRTVHVAGIDVTDAVAITEHDCNDRARQLTSASDVGMLHVHLPSHVRVFSESHRGGASVVSISRPAGPTLADLADCATDANPPLATKVPVMLPEAAFANLLVAIEAYCRRHLALPVHANIGPNAVRLSLPLEICPRVEENPWCVSDWALDPYVVQRETDLRKKSAAVASKRVQKDWLRVLRRSFLGDVSPRSLHTVGLAHLHNRLREKSPEVPLKSPLFYVVQRSGALAPREAIESALVLAVCGSVTASSPPAEASIQRALSLPPRSESPTSPVSRDDHQFSVENVETRQEVKPLHQPTPVEPDTSHADPAVRASTESLLADSDDGAFHQPSAVPLPELAFVPAGERLPADIPDAPSVNPNVLSDTTSANPVGGRQAPRQIPTNRPPAFPARTAKQLIVPRNNHQVATIQVNHASAANGKESVKSRCTGCTIQ